MYTIHYDGGELVNVRQNGSLFLTTENVTQEALGGVLRNVKIAGTPEEEQADLSGEYSLMRCSYFRDSGSECEFVLTPYAEAELAAIKTQADIDYIALMTGIQL